MIIKKLCAVIGTEKSLSHAGLITGTATPLTERVLSKTFFHFLYNSLVQLCLLKLHVLLAPQRSGNGVNKFKSMMKI